MKAKCNRMNDSVTLSLLMDESAMDMKHPQGLIVVVEGIAPDDIIEDASWLKGQTKLVEFGNLSFETALTELFYSYKNMYRVQYNVDVIISPYKITTEDGRVGTKCRFWYNTSMDVARCDCTYQKIVVREPYDDNVLDCYVDPAKVSVHYMTPAEYNHAPRNQKEGTCREKHDPRILLRKVPCIGGSDAVEVYNCLIEDFFEALSSLCMSFARENETMEKRVFTGVSSDSLLPNFIFSDCIVLGQAAAAVANGPFMQGGG